MARATGWVVLWVVLTALLLGVATIMLLPHGGPRWAGWFVVAATLSLAWIYGGLWLAVEKMAGPWQRFWAAILLMGHRDSEASSAKGRSERMRPLARLHYVLSDPVDPASLDAFLDHPVLTTQGNQFQRHGTPAQMVEDAVFDFAQDVERACAGRVTCDVAVKRGSLSITLTFFTAYGLIAQYHDFVESITLLRRQMQALLQRTSSWYRATTGRDMQVHADVSIASPTSAHPDKGAADEQRTYGCAPAALPGNDVRINVHVFSLAQTPMGCLALSIILLISGFLLAGVLCLQLESRDVCQEFGERTLARIMREFQR